jgi:sigma-B regulation protein RsbU (phosphoserine phosphatase)
VKTVFDLLRPQHQVRAAVALADSAAAPLEGRVLVVDDQEINQRILEQILSSGGLEVQVAAEGERALELARHGVDLILLDIVMPGIDGYETITRLRADVETRDIPVIFISALDEVSDKVRGLELGAADYVVKPFNRHEVLARVRAQLRIRQLSASLSRANAQLVEKQEVLSEDLRAAADIQKALLPELNLATAAVAIASEFQPSIEVGGDIFNVVPLGDGLIAAYVADVSGHGVASALLTVSVTQRLSAPDGLVRAAGATPAEIMRQLESEYPFERFGKYFSLVVAFIDTERGIVRYSSAGHPPPLVVRRNGNVERLEAGGPVVGMGFGLGFDEAEVALAAGDRLVLYTDGVTEDESLSGEAFGLDALAAHFAAATQAPLEDACSSLVDVLHDRRGDVPPHDDIALVGIELRH